MDVEVSNLASQLSAVIHWVGWMGIHPASSKVAIVAVIGPVTHCHLDLAFLSLAYNFVQVSFMPFLTSGPARLQIRIQACTWAEGM